MSAGPPENSGELVVRVSDVRHLFMAPEIDPLAESEAEVMGEAALFQVVRSLMAARDLRGHHKLAVLLPRDKLTTGLPQRVRDAVRRYCALKIRANDAQLQLMRREAGRLLVRGIIILACCMSISSLFSSHVLELPDVLSRTLAEGFNVIGWVMLWRPVEAFFFNPIPVKTSTAAHRLVQTLEIELRAHES